uniref:Uncharacterized protein n=1 Tax=Arundo donax TaxID=35708 RepID=A0A0A9G587_ARUDO
MTTNSHISEILVLGHEMAALWTSRATDPDLQLKAVTVWRSMESLVPSTKSLILSLYAS